MELNDIKKELYKQKPLAVFTRADKSGLKYKTQLVGALGSLSINVYFLVPYSDIGDATFEDNMDAKHMIRWIVYSL